MRTARALTVSRGGEGVYLPGPGRWGVPAWSGGVYLPGPRGGVPAWSGGRVYLPGPGGGCTCLVLGGVPAWSGGVPAWLGGWGCTCLVWGVYLPGPGGVYLPGPRGVYLPGPGGRVYLSGPGGCTCLVWGVPAWLGGWGCTCLVWGVYLPGPGGVYLPGPGGVCLPGPGGGCTCLVPGGVPGQALRPPPLWTEFLTHASENITLPQTSFAGGNNKLVPPVRLAAPSGKSWIRRCNMIDYF